MPEQHIQVCNSFHANKSEQFEWHNGVTTAPTNCNISQISGTTGPFVHSSPLAVPGKAAGGGPGVLACQIQSGLADGKYQYNVDCCTSLVSKSVTIP